MTNVSRTNRNGRRPRSDFYPTPPPATRALIAAEAAHLPSKIWEPAAGDGDIGVVFQEVSLCDVVMTEYRATSRCRHVRGGVDFLREKKLLAPAIVTNPPYRIANEFIRHALSLRPAYAAFFLPITYLAGVDRADMIEGEIGGCSLARVLVFRNRVTLAPRGLKLRNSGVTTYAWFIWTNERKLAPQIFRVSTVAALDSRALAKRRQRREVSRYTVLEDLRRTATDMEGAPV